MSDTLPSNAMSHGAMADADDRVCNMAPIATTSEHITESLELIISVVGAIIPQGVDKENAINELRYSRDTAINELRSGRNTDTIVQECVARFLEATRAQVNIKHGSLFKYLQEVVATLQGARAPHDVISAIEEFMSLYDMQDEEATCIILKAARKVAGDLSLDLLHELDMLPKAIAEENFADIDEIVDNIISAATRRSQKSPFKIFFHWCTLRNDLEYGGAESDFISPIHGFIKDFAQRFVDMSLLNATDKGRIVHETDVSTKYVKVRFTHLPFFLLISLVSLQDEKENLRKNLHDALQDK